MEDFNIFGYAKDHEREFILKERHFMSLSNDAFTIKDRRGQKLFEIDAKTFSLREKKVLKDCETGDVVWTMTRKTVSAHGSYELYKGDSTEDDALLCEFEPDLIGNDIGVEWKNGNEGPKLEAEGDFRSREYKLEKSRFGPNKVLAIISKQRKLQNDEEEDEDPQTYNAWMDGGVDAAFVIAVVLAIDEEAEAEDRSLKETAARVGAEAAFT